MTLIVFSFSRPSVLFDLDFCFCLDGSDYESRHVGYNDILPENPQRDTDNDGSHDGAAAEADSDDEGTQSKICNLPLYVC